MEEEYKVKQIYPAHADHISHYNDKFLEKMFEEDIVIAQPKYDGERMLVHFNGEEVYCTSRRHSKKTDRYMENQDKLKNLPHLPENIGYTVIDCECYANNWSEIVGVLHSLPERAYELQNTVNVRFACFDCLFFNGQDIRDLPYRERQTYLLATLLLMTDRRFHIVADTRVKSKEECFKIMNAAIEEGFEGIVVKSLGKHYYDKGAMLKCKKFETVDVVVYDFEYGNGKYENTVGALMIGYYDPETDTIKHLSNVNAGTDDDREYWLKIFNDNAFKPVRRVIEVKCQEITGRSLRHPVYIRNRDDKDYTMCTKDTIFKE